MTVQEDVNRYLEAGMPRTEEVPQAAQAWIGEAAVAFVDREGDVAVLAVHGEDVEYHVVRAALGRPVDAGPFEITVNGFGRAHGRDTVTFTVTDHAEGGR